MSGIKPTAYIKNKARVVIDNVQPNRQPLSTDHNRDNNQVDRIAVTGNSITADSSTDRSATRRLRRIQPGLGLLRAPSKEDTANTRSCDGHVVPVMSNPDSSSSTPLAIASVLHPSRGVSAVLPNSSRPTMPVKTLHLRKPPCDALLPDTGSELSSMDNFWARAPKPVLQPLVALPTQTSSGHFKERLEHGPTRELFRSRNFAESTQKPTAPLQHGTIESTRPQDIEQRLDSSVGRAADEPSPTNDPASDDKSYDSDNSSDKTPNARLSSRQAPHWMDESEIKTESGRTYSNAAIQDEQPGCTSPTVDSSSIPPFQAPINRKPESQMMRKDDSCLPYSLSVTRTVQGGLKRQAMENHSQAVAKERRTGVSSKVELLPPKLLRERTSSPYTKHMQRSIISRPSSAHSSREDTSSSRGPDTKHKLDILIGDTTRLRDELDQTDKENHRIREKCSQKTLELEKYKRDVKNIVTNIKSKQNKLSTQYSEIQSNVTGFIDSSREKLASSREDIGSIRKECSDLMKTLYSESESPNDGEIGERGYLGLQRIQDMKKYLSLTRELDEDRTKKQNVIDILRAKLEIQVGQVIESRSRIFELEDSLITHSRASEELLDKERKDRAGMKDLLEERLGELKSQLSLNQYSVEERSQARFKIESLEQINGSQHATNLRNEKELQKLTDSIDKSRIALADQAQKNSEYVANLALSRTKLEHATKNLHDQGIELQNSKEKVGEMSRTVSQKKSEITKVQGEYSDLLDKTKAVDRSLTESNVEKANLQCQIHELRESLKSQSNIEQVQEVHQVQYGKLQEKCEMLQSDVEHWRNQNSATLERFAKLSTSSNLEQARLTKLQENLQLQQSEALENAMNLLCKQENGLIVDLRSKICRNEHEISRLGVIEKRYVELKEANERLRETTVANENSRRDLQYRLDDAHQKWEDHKGRGDFAAGQVTVLQDKVSEAKAVQVSLNREIKDFKEQITNLKQYNQELISVGESQRSKETIDDLKLKLVNEGATRQLLEEAMVGMTKRFEHFEGCVLDISDRSKHSQADLSILSEKVSKYQEDLFEIWESKLEELSSLKVRESGWLVEKDKLVESLAAERKRLDEFLEVKIQFQKEQEKSHLLQLKASAVEELLRKAQETDKEITLLQEECHALRVSKEQQKKDASDQLQLATEQVNSEKQDAASSARKIAIAATEKKYEMSLMNSSNDLKKTSRKLADAESRLLAMSAELAKAKGKPSLEETFSISDQSESVILETILRPEGSKRLRDEEENPDPNLHVDLQTGNSSHRVQIDESVDVVKQVMPIRTSKRLRSLNPRDNSSKDTITANEASRTSLDCKQEEETTANDSHLLKGRKNAPKATKKK